MQVFDGLRKYQRKQMTLLILKSRAETIVTVFSGVEHHGKCDF